MAIHNLIKTSQSGSGYCLTRKPLQLLPVPAFFVLTATALPAFGDVGITGSLEYFKNPSRLENSEDSEHDVMRGLSLDANFSRSTERFDVIFDYGAFKQDYENNLQEDRSYVSGSGILRWNIVQDTFSWELSNRRTNQILEASLPSIPDNEQIVDVVSTGPTVNWQLGASSSIVLDAEFARATYENSERSDNDRVVLSGDFNYRLSQVLSSTLRISNTDTRFRFSNSPLDYQLTSLSGLLMYDRSNLGIELELGEYRVERDVGTDTEEPLRSITANYTLNSRSSVSLGYSESVQDLVSDATRWFGFQLNDSGEFGDDEQSIASSEADGIYKYEVVSAGYNFDDADRFRFSLSYRDEDREYINSARSEVWESVSALFGFNLGESSSIDLSVTASELQFFQNSDTHDRLIYRAGWSYRPNQRFSFRVQLQALEQDGETFGSNYDDDSALVSMTYRFGQNW